MVNNEDVYKCECTSSVRIGNGVFPNCFPFYGYLEDSSHPSASHMSVSVGKLEEKIRTLALRGFLFLFYPVKVTSST